jgi:hypothetical protein
LEYKFHIFQDPITFDYQLNGPGNHPASFRVGAFSWLELAVSFLEALFYLQKRGSKTKKGQQNDYLLHYFCQLVWSDPKASNPEDLNKISIANRQFGVIYF